MKVFIEDFRTGEAMKRCPKCTQYKKLDNYAKAPDRPHGVTSWCLECRRPKRKYKSADDWFWKHFWARTIRQGDCLIWTGRIVGGLPSCEYKGRRQNVRRLVYRLAVGELSDDMIIIMKCKTKYCVRQDHMMRGTKEDQHVKRANCIPTGDNHYTHVHPEKRRLGEDNPSAKLDESKVRAIRSKYVPRKNSCTMLAAEFGVAPTLISQIVRRKIWAHVE